MNNHNHADHSAYTLIELLAMIAMIALLACVLLPALARAKKGKNRIHCVSHLKQIGLSFRIWAGDSRDGFPMTYSTNQGGTMELLSTPEVFQHFQALSNELGTPFVLACPADKERSPALNFSKLNNSELSYFLSHDASETLPETILAGDRNITNGFTPTNGMLELTTNHVVGWTKENHKFEGNVALGDGSVQQVNSARLRSEVIAKSDLATNRIQLP